MVDTARSVVDRAAFTSEPGLLVLAVCTGRFVAVEQCAGNFQNGTVLNSDSAALIDRLVSGECGVDDGNCVSIIVICDRVNRAAVMPSGIPIEDDFIQRERFGIFHINRAAGTRRRVAGESGFGKGDRAAGPGDERAAVGRSIGLERAAGDTYRRPLRITVDRAAVTIFGNGAVVAERRIGNGQLVAKDRAGVIRGVADKLAVGDRHIRRTETVDRAADTSCGVLREVAAGNGNGHAVESAAAGRRRVGCKVGIGDGQCAAGENRAAVAAGGNFMGDRFGPASFHSCGYLAGPAQSLRVSRIRIRKIVIHVVIELVNESAVFIFDVARSRGIVGVFGQIGNGEVFLLFLARSEVPPNVIAVHIILVINNGYSNRNFFGYRLGYPDRLVFRKSTAVYVN